MTSKSTWNGTTGLLGNLDLDIEKNRHQNRK